MVSMGPGLPICSAAAVKMHHRWPAMMHFSSKESMDDEYQTTEIHHKHQMQPDALPLTVSMLNLR